MTQLHVLALRREHAAHTRLDSGCAATTRNRRWSRMLYLNLLMVPYQGIELECSMHRTLIVCSASKPTRPAAVRLPACSVSSQRPLTALQTLMSLLVVLHEASLSALAADQLTQETDCGAASCSGCANLVSPWSLRGTCTCQRQSRTVGEAVTLCRTCTSTDRAPDIALRQVNLARHGRVRIAYQRYCSIRQQHTSRIWPVLG